jgi:hypothetical protein
MKQVTKTDPVAEAIKATALPKDEFLAAFRAWGKAQADGAIKSAEVEKSKGRQVDQIILAMQIFAKELPALVESKIKSPVARMSAGFKAAKKSCLAETITRIKAYEKAKKPLPRSEALLKKYCTRGIKARRPEYQDVLWYADDERGRGIAAFQDLIAKPGRGEKPIMWAKIARTCAKPRIEATKAFRAALNTGFAADGSVFYLGKDVEDTHDIKPRTIKGPDGKEVTERHCVHARNEDEDVEVVVKQVPAGLQYKACLKLMEDVDPRYASWARYLKDVDELQRLMHEEFQLDTTADDE